MSAAGAMMAGTACVIALGVASVILLPKLGVPLNDLTQSQSRSAAPGSTAPPIYIAVPSTQGATQQLPPPRAQPPSGAVDPLANTSSRVIAKRVEPGTKNTVETVRTQNKKCVGDGENGVTIRREWDEDLKDHVCRKYTLLQ